MKNDVGSSQGSGSEWKPLEGEARAAWLNNASLREVYAMWGKEFEWALSRQKAAA